MANPRDYSNGGGSNASTTKRLDPFKFPHPATRLKPPPVTLENVRYLFANNGISVGFNVIGKRMEAFRDGQRISEADIVSLAAEYRMQGSWLLTFVDQIARGNPINPVKAWIESKPWDGKDRFESLLDTMELADDYPPKLARTLLYRWLLSAVAAAALEGRRFSTRGVLTLQGPQGVGKTTWICNLVSDQALRDQVVRRDHHMDGGNKDSILGAIQHWIVEIGELDGSFKRDIARLKGFLTNDCDKVRPPYGKGVIEFDRRTVFAGSVNDETFLVDPTGNSRFWTVSVKGLNFNHGIDMQQLFAQLMADFTRGEQWWLTPEEEQMLAEYNLQHRSVCAIVERVKDHIDIMASGADAGTYMTATELLKDLGISNPTNMQAKECGTALRELIGPPKRVQGRDQWRIVRRDAFKPDRSLIAPKPVYGHPDDRF